MTDNKTRAGASGAGAAGRACCRSSSARTSCAVTLRSVPTSWYRRRATARTSCLASSARSTRFGWRSVSTRRAITSSPAACAPARTRVDPAPAPAARARRCRRRAIGSTSITSRLPSAGRDLPAGRPGRRFARADERADQLRHRAVTQGFSPRRLRPGAQRRCATSITSAPRICSPSSRRAPTSAASRSRARPPARCFHPADRGQNARIARRPESRDEGRYPRRSANELGKRAGRAAGRVRDPV